MLIPGGHHLGQGPKNSANSHGGRYLAALCVWKWDLSAARLRCDHSRSQCTGSGVSASASGADEDASS